MIYADYIRTNEGKTQSDPLLKPQPDYKFHLDMWELVRSVLAGKKTLDTVLINDLNMTPDYETYPVITDSDGAIVSGSTAQKIKLQKRKYWERARLLNALRETVESFDGMIWSKDMIVEVPNKLAEIDLLPVAQRTTFDTICIGRYIILVDMKNTNGQMTIAEAESSENIPKFITYKAEQAYNTRYKGDTLLEVRLIETYETKDEDGFNYSTSCQVRRLIMIDGEYHNQVWRDQDMVEDTIPKTAKGESFDFIPAFFFDAKENSPKIDYSPMYDLASENVGHYRLSADNLENLHYHGQGMTNVYTNMDNADVQQKNPKGLSIGAGGRNLLGPNDKVELLQLEANGAIPAEMIRVEQRMAMIGAQLVMNTNQNQTLGAKKIETNASTSTLKRIALNCSEGLTTCMIWAAMFVGEPTEDIKVQLNDKFYTDDLTAQDIQVIMQAVQASLLPQQSLWEASRNNGYTTLTDEEIQEQIQDEMIGGGTTEEVATLQARLDAIELANGNS